VRDITHLVFKIFKEEDPQKIVPEKQFIIAAMAGVSQNPYPEGGVEHKKD